MAGFGLVAVVLYGDYERMEQVALGFGACLLIFVVAAFLCQPSWGEIAQSTIAPPLTTIMSSERLRELTVASIGTTVSPWLFLSQSSAVIQKGLGSESLSAMQWDTLLGSCLSQVVAVSVLITFASQAQGAHLMSLSMAEVFQLPLLPVLGEVATRICLAFGLFGCSMLASLVVCMGAAWSIAECTFGHLPPAGLQSGVVLRSATFRVFFCGSVLFASGVVTWIDIDLVELNVLIQILNGFVMPLVGSFVLHLACTALPEGERVRGIRAVLLGL